MEDPAAKWPNLSLERDPKYQGCFGCGKDNPAGLKLDFHWDGTTARAEFTPDKRFQGWPDLLHGGITACVLDEAMGYAALFAVGKCVTAKMNIRLKKPAMVGQRLLISSTIKRSSRRLVETEAVISLEDGTVVSESTGTHYVVIANANRSQA